MAKRVIQTMVVIITGILFVGMVHAGTDDSNLKEVGIEWVCNYPQPDYLPYADDDAKGFYNAIASHGWTKRFDYGDSNAWEEHFKKESMGGTDYNYADDVDFVYFSGHGHIGGFNFISYHDDTTLEHSDAAWGDKDLEWITIDACEVLNNDDGKVFQRWGTGFTGGSNVFMGLHQILGFATTINSPGTRGEKFVWYMTSRGKNIKDAWFKACDDTYGGAGYKVAAIMYVCGPNDAGGDYLPSYGSVAVDSNTPNCLAYQPHTCH